MKNLAAIFVLGGVMVSAPVHAMFIEEIDIFRVLNSSDDDPDNDSVTWLHNYDGSENPVSSAFLTIVAEDVDPGEQVEVWLGDEFLGLLNDQGFLSFGGVSDIHLGPGCGECITSGLSTTVFEINPLALLPLNIFSAFETGRLFGSEIETATLTVTREISMPEPTIGLLMLIGLFLLVVNQRTAKSQFLCISKPGSNA